MIAIDMEMPRCCAECPLMETVETYSYRCIITTRNLGSFFEEWIPFADVPRLEKRAEDCPLIEMGEKDEARGV